MGFVISCNLKFSALLTLPLACLCDPSLSHSARLVSQSGDLKWGISRPCVKQSESVISGADVQDRLYEGKWEQKAVPVFH